MDIVTIVLLFAAGLAGGIANAIAGGATLITFPALLAAGLPPVVANASNAVAVSPGHLVAALADRAKWPPMVADFAITAIVAALGGALGALLLLVTPDRLFTLFVPGLIGLATFVFAFSKQIRAALPAIVGSGLRLPLIFATAIYGGYFGAGLGVMLLAILSLSSGGDARTTNASKNLLATAVSVVSVATFVVGGLVSWPATLIVLMGSLIGGYLGGRLLARLPAPAVRIAVIAIGVAMTIAYGWRYWF